MSYANAHHDGDLSNITAETLDIAIEEWVHNKQHGITRQYTKKPGPDRAAILDYVEAPARALLTEMDKDGKNIGSKEKFEAYR